MSDKAYQSSSATAVAEPDITASGIDEGLPGETQTILLLDGVRLFLKLEETLLARADWRLLSATSAEEARRILENEKVDLVLMDYVLPDCTGDEMVRWIRENPKTASVGVLIVTARGLRDHVDRCMAAGCTDFLFKPVSRAVLCGRVQEMLKVPARRHLRTLVRVQVNGSVNDRFVFGNTVNLSVGGMLLESPVDLANGDCIDLRFFLPGDERPLTCVARIVRSSQGEGLGVSIYGLVFENLPDTDRERIARYVAMSGTDDSEMSA